MSSGSVGGRLGVAQALILCCVAAPWFALRALEDGRTRWLLCSGACVGLGSEAKMSVALVVVPGIALAWLWTAPVRSVAVRVRRLLSCSRSPARP